ncbi:hypothetical protein JRO89_XS02G0227900 [Xanthoceras sorbifolium]|uniref:DEAD-box helicase OB fold domain-containing protein n=1 Tax=Xanthoceras sorbifolium TaxID=99658 RepID=A0ABQ8IHD0_9ROSI|nr:hypothetical protein JRO89_XS02G0227900 [Xanthoceras sorbifolium]
MAMLSNGKHFFHFPIEILILKEFLQAILCAGLYPNVAATEQGIAAVALSNFRKSTNSASKAYTVWYDGRREVHIHPSSINNSLKAFQHPFLVFLEKVRHF